jgi:putative membrane protein
MEMKHQLKTAAASAAVMGVLLSSPYSGIAAEDTQQGQQSSQGASQSQAAKPGGQQKLQGDERQFMMKAAQGCMLEVEASKLAIERASSQQVKDYAKMLHEDHTAANEKLMELAQQKGVDLPKVLDPKHKQDLARLQKLQGEEFDRAYLEHMGMKDHRKDIQDFEKQARSAKDAQVKSFAEQTLPTLRKHLTQAQQIAGSIAQSKPSDGSATGGADSQGKQQ